jgi:hypothetical protein
MLSGELESARGTGAIPPAISAVLATRDGWPRIRSALQPILDEARAAEVEVIVADGSGYPPPDRDELGMDVDWLERPGASVLQLYGVAIGHARGPIIAMTEDHCRPHAGWLSGIRRAFDEHPEADAVGGAIENGSTETPVDWASFFMTQGVHMAPLAPRPRLLPNESNVAYRRSALEGISRHGGRGVILLLHNQMLRRQGALLMADDRFVVDHHQSVPLGETSALHFHNGRVIAGLSRGNMTARDLLRLVAWPVFPIYRSARTVRTILRKGRYRRQLLQSLPYILWLEYCHAAGAAIGYLTGPGRSADALH